MAKVLSKLYFVNKITIKYQMFTYGFHGLLKSLLVNQNTLNDISYLGIFEQ